MLKIISGAGSIALILAALFLFAGFDIGPVIYLAGIFAIFITFVPVALKWNWYCFKTYGLFSFSGIKEFIDIFKKGITERKENGKQFVLMYGWLLYLVLFIAFFQFMVLSTSKYVDTVMQATILLSFVPFSSFYFVFIDSIRLITDKR